MRKLTRLQSLIAGSAFAAASVLGAPAAALAAGSHPSVPSDHVVTNHVVTDHVVTNHVVTNPLGASLNPLNPTTPTTATASGPQSASTASPTSTPAAATDAAQAPTDADLHPVPVTAEQKTFTPDHDQLANAKAIVDTAKQMNLPPRAYEIAVATALQESNLHNLGHLGANNDHDSLGLFQQRTGTGGWGTPGQIMDPHHATQAFLNRLVKIPGWDTMPLTTAAQKVQVSAYPQAYAKHETQAANIINALHGTGPYADQATDLR